MTTKIGGILVFNNNNPTIRLLAVDFNITFEGSETRIDHDDLSWRDPAVISTVECD